MNCLRKIYGSKSYDIIVRWRINRDSAPPAWPKRPQQKSRIVIDTLCFLPLGMSKNLVQLVSRCRIRSAAFRLYGCACFVSSSRGWA